MIAFSLRDLMRERHNEAQTILGISHFDSLEQPLPIQVWMAHHDPGKGFGQPCFEIRRHQRREEYLRGVLSPTSLQVREAGVSQCSKRFGELLWLMLIQSVDWKFGSGYFKLRLELG